MTNYQKLASDATAIHGESFKNQIYLQRMEEVIRQRMVVTVENEGEEEEVVECCSGASPSRGCALFSGFPPLNHWFLGNKGPATMD